MCEITKRGKEGIVLCSKPFVTLGRTQARINGVADLPMALIDHPVGGTVEQVVRQRAAQALPQVLARMREVFRL